MYTYLLVTTRAPFPPRADEQLVDGYAEMEAHLLTTPFSFGTAPNFGTDLEFETDLNVAAFTISPTEVSPSTSSSSNPSTPTAVVSVLKMRDRQRALEACLNGKSLVDVRSRLFVLRNRGYMCHLLSFPFLVHFLLTFPFSHQGTIKIEHSKNVSCYPLTHVIEAVIPSEFSQETCEQSILPSTLYNIVRIALNNLITEYSETEGVYTPFESPEFGTKLFQDAMASLRASIKCGDYPLVTPDLYRDSAARITQGERNYGVVYRDGLQHCKQQMVCFLLMMADSRIFIVCASSVAMMSALMLLSAIVLSTNLNHPLIRSAGGITLVMYIGFLFFKMTVTVLFMYDAEQLEGICLLRPIAFLIGVAGSSAVLFFRMLRWELRAQSISLLQSMYMCSYEFEESSTCIDCILRCLFSPCLTRTGCIGSSAPKAF